MDTAEGAHVLHPLTVEMGGEEEEEEKKEVARQRRRGGEMSSTLKKRKSVLWHFFGRRVPKTEIVFVCQMLLVFVVVCVSLYNLTLENKPDKLWVVLLSSSIGYALPNPTLGGGETRHQ